MRVAHRARGSLGTAAFAAIAVVMLETSACGSAAERAPQPARETAQPEAAPSKLPPGYIHPVR